jgi:hypothetical protein
MPIPIINFKFFIINSLKGPFETTPISIAKNTKRKLSTEKAIKDAKNKFPPKFKIRKK